MSTGDAIAAIFETYAEHAGKPRWGDKTPMYMRHLSLPVEEADRSRYYPGSWPLMRSIVTRPQYRSPS